MLPIDWISPLPPVRSGIADYSRDLLPALDARVDLRVVALSGAEPELPDGDRYRFVGAEAAGLDGRLPVYQMGNNQYHLEVYELALERPGVVTLHDLVLHHFLAERTLKQRRFEPYEATLVEDHGWIGRAAAQPRRFGAYGDASHFGLPVNRHLLVRQRGVLVHSRWARESLLEDEPALEVRTIPMGVPLAAPADEAVGRELRSRLGIPDRALLLGSFGFQTPIKRTDVVLQALAREGLRDAHLLVGGDTTPVPRFDLEADARDLGVADRVHFLGFLPFEELEAAIAACDLCLNLRFPSAGETSASLLRVLAVGKPVIVSDFAQFSELPDEVALKVPLGRGEVEILAASAAALAAHPEQLESMAAAARRHVATEHDPERATDAIVEALRELAEVPIPPVAGAADPPRPTTVTWGHLPARLSVEGWEAWPEGTRRTLEVRLENTGFSRWLAGEAGPGSVVLEVVLAGSQGDALEHLPWVPLPRSVAPGETVVVEVEARRPVGPARLSVKPHVLGGQGFPARPDGPYWERSV